MTHKITSLLVLAVLSTLAPVTDAQNGSNTDVAARSSRSISYAADDTATKDQRRVQLQHAAMVTAEAPQTAVRLESNLKALHSSGSYNPDFSIYDVRTILISDYDDDGFYHRFSLRIDADTLFGSAWVYARLYVSHEGGPWTWYATSDDYHISGDSSLDSFVIETELVDGYPAGYYDIRIELYDAEYGDFLLSVGPYDDSSLVALPLEDSYRDDNDYGVSIGVGVQIGVPADTEVVISAAGASSLWLTAPLAVLLSVRLSRRRQHK